MSSGANYEKEGTTNTIEVVNRQPRKVTKAKAVFPTDDSLLTSSNEQLAALGTSQKSSRQTVVLS